jgi:hypothetical protein
VTTCNGEGEGVRGIKHDFSKPQYSLLPLKDLEGVVRVLENGAKKYARGDWRFVPNGEIRYLDACLRHVADHQAGFPVDAESGLLALDHAIVSLMFARAHYVNSNRESGPIC